MLKVARSLFILIGIILILAACNLPSNATPTEDPNAVFTAAALTVQAQLTQSAPFKTPTLPVPAATNTSVSFPTLPASTLPPAASPTPACDQAAFVKDVNIPDGSQITPGGAFTKTWRLKNAGVCTWSGYTLVLARGDAMGSTSPQTIGTVLPGQEVDLSVNFTAPTAAGSYRSYWQIRNSSGGPIPVLGGTQGNSYNQKLEDGSSPSKVLEVYPQMVNDGSMTGLYPAYTVVPGEHFKAKIGFLALPDGTCGAGNVKFQLNYKEVSGTFNSLGEWADTCDGILKEIDLNLSGVAGKSVQFVLAVLANGPATQDSAVWVNPRVEVPE